MPTTDARLIRYYTNNVVFRDRGSSQIKNTVYKIEILNFVDVTIINMLDPAPLPLRYPSRSHIYCHNEKSEHPP